MEDLKKQLTATSRTILTFLPLFPGKKEVKKYSFRVLMMAMFLIIAIVLLTLALIFTWIRGLKYT